MTRSRRFVDFLNNHLTFLLGAALFTAIWIVYASTVPPAQVFGDPSEYTFIPWILGIAHPPGYGFYTLLASLWQHLLPIGSVAFRTHLLAATAGALSATLVYLIVYKLIVNRKDTKSAKESQNNLAGLASSRLVAHLPALFAGISLVAATDIWQHSIHANAHIITLLLATTSVFLLIQWWSSGKDRWLYLFALIAGFSPPHHLLLVFAFPAYAIFIVLVKPRLFLQPKKILALLGCFALGLSVFLYYPLRSPSAPFGPNTITSPQAFIDFVSAAGLRVNLFYYGLGDQLTRFGVFFELLKLQYSIIGILLVIPGAIWLARRAWKPFVLCAVFFLSLYFFIINTVQDVMAYLMLPFMMIAVFSGLGAWAIVTFRLPRSKQTSEVWRAAILAALLLLPIAQLILTYPRVSLRNYTAGGDWVDTVFDRFAGKSERAVLLAPWEANTPLWVAKYTEGRTLDPKDVTPIYVTTASQNPWLDNVFAHLNEGPVYLADYRRPVVEGRLFRLRPEGSLWRVVPPGDASVPPLDRTLNMKVGEGENTIEILGYSIDRDSVEAGQRAYLTLAMRAPLTPTHILMPYGRLGARELRWTTDSRLLTPEWRPNEVIVERYEIPIAFDTPAGDYDLRLGFSNLSTGQDVLLPVVPLQALRVTEATRPHAVVPADALANFNAQIALTGASANGVSSTPELPTITVKPGETIELGLNWLAQQQVDESYTIFVHLIDGSNRLIAQRDYTPMGGAFPTQLWIPKWIAGQSVNDPYQIQVPDDLPPGEYFIEAGMYGMTSQ
ncbi:MAG: DUF2723 domain-containing protein, partial [Chloroflexi bacterium]|nr:DUF2723 domain-containing protein [Chloroflexota bacterium]